MASNVIYNDELKYPKDHTFFQSEEADAHHKITGEICARLVELDELTSMPGSDYGIRLLRLLAAVELESQTAYRILIDALSEKKNLVKTFDEIAMAIYNSKGKPVSRQATFGIIKQAIEVVKSVDKPTGDMLDVLYKRQHTSNGI